MDIVYVNGFGSAQPVQCGKNVEKCRNENSQIKRNMCSRKSVSREEESNESRSNELGVGTSFSMESDGQFVTLSSHSNGRFTSIGVSMSSLGYAANRNQGNEDDYDEDDDDDERSWAIPTARAFRICPHGHIIPNEPVRRFGNANNARNNREDPMNSLD